MLGVSVQTLHKWEETGELLPARKSKGGTRYYDADKLFDTPDKQPLTIAYARVSSHDQQADLGRQISLLETFCHTENWSFDVISDLGSGINYKKKGLKRLLKLILNKEIERLVLTHKDRLLGFGAELIFTLCEMQHIEIIIINTSDETSFEEELAKDVLEIITVFSARLDGSRSDKNKKLMGSLVFPVGSKYRKYNDLSIIAF